jgi:hypothetical protein
MHTTDIEVVTLWHPGRSKAVVALPFECHDALTRVAYIELPEARLALVQAAFELAEGLGVVRTVAPTTQSPRERLTTIAVITTSSQVEACGEALLEILGPPDTWPTFGNPAQERPVSNQSMRGGWCILDPRLPMVRGAVQQGLLGE